MPQSTAVLRVFVTTARGAFPLDCAAVRIYTHTDEPELLHALRTDRSGMTPPVALETPPRAASLSPGGAEPFAVYTVTVEREGYIPRTAVQVPLFAGVPTVLPVTMTPLTEQGSDNAPQLTAEGEQQALREGEQ